MARKKSTYVMLASMLALLAYSIVLYAQSAQSNPANKPPQAAVEGPVVNFTPPNSPDTADSSRTADEQARRHAKNARYDNPALLPFTEDPALTPGISSSHWWVHLPALPVSQSDAIAVGSVTDSRAFLSNDRCAVYSEFYLQVEQVLKDGTQSISPGTVITTTRFGGIIHFASGRRYAYRVPRQGWPATGSRYVLFLRKNQSGDFDIVTGYELRDGVAKPLDGTDLHGPLPFQQYAGTPEPALLDAIKAALTNSTAGAHNL
jgi:hypothetical protein